MKIYLKMKQPLQRFAALVLCMISLLLFHQADVLAQGANCADPFVVNSNSISYSGTTCGFGDDYDSGNMTLCDPLNFNFYWNEDFLIEFTATETGCYSFSSTGGVTVTFFDGCPDTGNCIWEDNFSSEYGMVAGETVYILIDDEGLFNSCTSFSFDMSIASSTVPNDLCAGATTLSGDGTNYGATCEPNAWAPDNGNTGANICDNAQIWSSNENGVWYEFTNDATQTVDITIQNIVCNGTVGGTLQIGVWTNSGSCNLDSETLVDCIVANGTSTLSLTNLPAGDYYLFADGTAGDQCEWQFISDEVIDPPECGACGGNPPPADDECVDANVLSPMNPPDCDSGNAGDPVSQTVQGSNICATPEDPYAYITGCTNGGDMAAPAASVWYQVNVTGTSLTIDIGPSTGGEQLANPNVGLWLDSGAGCGALQAAGCQTGTGGSLSAQFTPINPGTYYIQVSGGDENDQCDFSMTLTNNFNCDLCLTDQTFVANPPPVNGFYNGNAGAVTVEFCYTVSEYNPTDVNWIHGVVPTLGSGWNASTLTPSSTPASCDGAGDWGWYTGTVTGLGTGSAGAVGPGFFYERPEGDPLCGVFLPAPCGDPDDPGDNWGDADVGPSCPLTFCWEVSSLAACNEGADLSVSVDTYSDSETGGYGVLGCETDPFFIAGAQQTCCTDPTVALNGDASICAGDDTPATLTATATGTPAPSYEWTADGVVIPGETGSSLFVLPSVTTLYSVTVANNCNSAEEFFTVVVEELPTIIPTLVPVDCAGADNGEISLAVSGGSGSYSYTWTGPTDPGNVASATSLPPGNYMITIDDGFCPQTIDVPVPDGEPSENFDFTISAMECNIGTVSPVLDPLAVTDGEWTADSGVVIDATTGEIDLAASTAGGPYNITYGPAGGATACSTPVSQPITISACQCPTSTAPSTPEQFCDDGVAAITPTLPDNATLTGTITDAGFALDVDGDTEPDISWWSDAGYTTAYGGADLTYGGDGCAPEVQTFYATILCDLDGDDVGDDTDSSGSVDEGDYILVGTYEATIYPNPQEPTINIDDSVCNFSLSFACAGDSDTANDFGMLSSPGDAAGTASVTVENAGGCSVNFPAVPYDACAGCPTVTGTATGSFPLCDNDGLMDMATDIEPLVSWDAPTAPVTITGVEYYLTQGTPPTDPYVPGSVSADLTTSCDPVTETVYVYAVCDIDGTGTTLTYLDAGSFDVVIYPDLTNLNITVDGDGTCGPSVSAWDCDAATGYSIANDYDANGVSPDFGSATDTGNVTFTVTNSAAPAACQTVTATAAYNCTTCPDVTALASGSFDFCGDDSSLDLLAIEGSIAVDPPVAPIQNDGIEFYTTAGNPPSDAYSVGNLSADLATSCDPVTQTVYAYYLCDVNGDDSVIDYVAAGSFDIIVYPDLSTLSITTQDDGDCGPSAPTYDCQGSAGYSIANDYDGNAATPDFSAETMTGTVNFTVSNSNAPAGCNTSTPTGAAYNCAACPSVTATASGSYDFCDNDGAMDLTTIDGQITYDTPISPVAISGIEYYLTQGTPPTDAYTPGAVSTALIDGCDPVTTTIYPYVVCDLLGDGTQLEYIEAGSFDVVVYPDLSSMSITVDDDGGCGPSVSAFECEADADYVVSNDYDANGDSPDFSAETSAGNVTFTVTNSAAPAACQTVTANAGFNCTTCPSVTTPATGSFDFCLDDSGMDVTTVAAAIVIDAAIPPIQNDGIEFFTTAGTPPSDPYVPGSLAADLATSCDPVMQTVFAYYLCDVNGDDSVIDYVAAGSFDITVYPDLSTLTITTQDDGACGPGAPTYDCQGSAGYSIDNDYDAGGANPDFSSETLTGTVNFTVSNSNAPAGCNSSMPQPAAYNCTTCPAVTSFASGTYDFCDNDGAMDLTTIDAQIAVDPASAPVTIDGVEYYLTQGTPPSDPYTPGAVATTLGDGCDPLTVTVYPYVICDLLGDDSLLEYIEAGSFDVTVYPDLSAMNVTVDDDGACGPSVSAFDCDSNPNYVVTNDYDAGGSLPDFSAETTAGNVTFTITNSNAPAACQTVTANAAYNCTVCPAVTTPAGGTFDFCSSDLGMDVTAVEGLMVIEPAVAPIENDGIEFYTTAGNPPSDPYVAGSLVADLGTSCDPVTQTVFAYYLCDINGDDSVIDYVAAGSFDITVYPDLSVLNITVQDDGACGPSAPTYDCQGSTGYSISNDYDGNGANPDFSAETVTGTMNFTVTNANAPAGCDSSLPQEANYNCTTCPAVTAMASGNYDFCDNDGAMDLALVEAQISYDTPSSPVAINGIEYYLALGNPPTGPYTPGAVTADLSLSCDPVSQTIYPYVVCDLLGDGSMLEYIEAGSFDVTIYPDLTSMIIDVNDDGACGPSVPSFECDAAPGYEVSNDYDANGASPDFSSEMTAGNVTFTVTNTNAPAACQTVTANAAYNCTVCPNVTAPAAGSFDFCSSDTDMDVSAVESLMVIEAAVPPIENDGIEFYTTAGNPPTDPYVAGSLVADIATSCDPVTQTVYAYYLCDLNGDDSVIDYVAAGSFDIVVYPDLSILTIQIDDDGACGPSAPTYDCQGATGYSISNDYDGNGANPDFASETLTGTVNFTVTNANAPAACSTSPAQDAAFNCTTCPDVTAQASGNYDFCDNDGAMDLSQVESQITYDAPASPVAINGVAYFLAPGNPPTGPYTPGAVTADLVLGCDPIVQTVYPYVVCDLLGDGSMLEYLEAGNFDVTVYPDLTDMSITVDGDGTCGPSVSTFECDNVLGYSVSNDYDANGANPDFSSETAAGNVTFTITNNNSPAACQTVTANAGYNCTECPAVTTPAAGTFDFCSSDTDMDIAAVEAAIIIEAAEAPIQNDGIEFYTTAGSPPSDPYVAGNLVADIAFSCEPVTQTVFAYYLCDLNGDDSVIDYVAAGSFDLVIYPDLSILTISLDDDGACGPSAPTFDCQGAAGYSISNDYDGNGANPDFSAETLTGTMNFTVSNSNAPAGCDSSLPQEAAYNCTTCPDVTALASGNYDFCDNDGAMDLTQVESQITYDLPASPVAISGVQYFLAPGNPPTGPYTPGAVTADLVLGCDPMVQTVYPYVVCDLLGDGSMLEYLEAGNFDVTVYPDLSDMAVTLDGDGSCGPALTAFECDNVLGFSITNDYDTGGANPDFGAETAAGNVTFTITNTNAPAACQTVTVNAGYNCTVCPNVTTPANGSFDFCSSDLDMDLAAVESLMIIEAAIPPIQNDGIEFYTTPGNPPSDPYVAGSLVADIASSCDPVTQTVYAYYVCDVNGDDTVRDYVAAGSFDIIVYPDLSILTIQVEDDGACGPSAPTFDCQGAAGYSISNDYDGTGATPDFSAETSNGTFNFVVSNSNAPAGCNESLPQEASYDCADCPTSSEPAELTAICDGDIPMLPDAAIQIGVSDPNGTAVGGASPTVTWYRDVALSIAYEGTGISHSGVDNCAEESVTLYAAIECSLDASIIAAGTLEIIVHPEPQAPTITKLDDECTYSLNLACPDTDNVVSNSFPLSSLPGDPSGIATVVIDNGDGLCTASFDVPYDPCNDCPSSTQPSLTVDICDAGIPQFPDDIIQASIDDPDGVAVGAPDPVVEWCLDAALTIPYLGDPLTHSGVDPCITETTILYAAIECSIDGSLINAGTLTATLYPEPQVPTITLIDDVCNYSLSLACPGLDNVVSNSFNLTTNPGDPSGSATVVIDNGGNCVETFEVPYDGCTDCPTSLEPTEVATICTSESPGLPDAAMQAGVVDPGATAVGAPNPVISWYTDAGLTSTYDGTGLSHSGADPCSSEEVILYAAIECTIDGSMIPAGQLVVTVYPEPQAPGITLDDSVCNYSLVLVCPALDNVVSNDFGLTSAPGSGAGLANIVLDNMGGCSETFAVPYEACGGCPTSTAPAEVATICTGDIPTLPDAALQAAVSDPSSTAVGAPNPTITWFTDATFTNAYDGSAISHSGVDLCAIETVTLYAAIECAIDASLIAAGSLELTVYPQPQAPTITKDDDVCNYTLNLACPALDNVVSNDFGLVSAPGDAAGTASVVIDNGGGICSETFTVNYDACNACPSSSQPQEVATICTGETPTLPTAIIEAAVNDANGEALGAPNPTITWYTDDLLTSVYDGSALNHSGADNCLTEQVTLYATIQCAIDNSIINAGTLTVTVYPSPQAPSIVIDDAVCNYTLVLACPALDLVESNDFDLNSVPGDPAGSATILIENMGLCAETFIVPYEACGGCPTSTAPAEAATICTGDIPTLPEATLQTAISDPAGTAVGAPSPTITWFTDATFTNAYDGSAISHSGVDPCAIETVTLYAAIECTIDASLIAAGSLDLTVYPQPQAPTITKDDDVCNYTLNLACPALDNVVSNDFGLVSAAGDAAGTATIVIDNGGGICSETFTVNYDACNSCPSSTQPQEQATICTGETPTLPTAIIEAAINDPNGEAVGTPTPTITWYTDDVLTNVYDGSALNHSGADNCLTEQVTLYATIQCAIDNSIINAGTVTVTVYPSPQAPSIVIDDALCNYTLLLACPALDVLESNDFDMTSDPGDPAGTATIVIENMGLCAETFTVPYEACAGCPTSTEPEDDHVICTGDIPVIDTAIQEAAISDPAGTALPITWYLDPAFNTPYDGGPLNHSGVDNCTLETVVLYAAVGCSIDGSLIPAGTIDVLIYPFSQAPTITKDDDTCNYTLNLACPGFDVILSNSFDLTSAPGDAAGTATIEIDNGSGLCTEIFEVPYDACNSCPSSSQPAETTTLCSGEVPAIPAGVFFDAINDPNGTALGAPTPVVTMFEDINLTVPYLSTPLVHSGADLCTTEQVTLYAAIECTIDGSLINAGTLTATVYPAPQAPTLVQDDAVCNYTLVLACPALDNVLSNDFGLVSAPGDAVGTANIEIDNAAGCSDTFVVDYAACGGCPGSTEPELNATICTGDTPVLPDTDIQAGVNDPDGNAVGAPAPVITWYEDATLTSTYDGSAINHSGVDPCTTETQTLYAAIECAIDGTIIAAGSFVITIYPDPQAPTITKDDDVCNYSLNLACPAMDNVVSNSFDLTSDPGEAAGTATIVIDNGGGICSVSFEVPYNACNACPSSTQPTEAVDLCDGDTPVLPDAVMQAAVDDPNGEAVGAPDPVISWFEDIDLTIPYAGTALTHSGADPCATESITLYAAVECAIDNTLINAGTLNATVYPAPQAPTIVIDDEVCNYTLILACPALDNIVSNDFDLTSVPGDAAGTATIVIDNAGACSESFAVVYDSCGGCPTSTEPGDVATICTGDSPALPDALMQAAVTDLSGTAAGGAVPTITWFTDAGLTSPYDGLGLSHSGVDQCNTETQTLYAAIECTIDASLIAAGTLDVTIYPDPQAPTITKDDDLCNYTLNLACPGFDNVLNNDFSLSTSPGDPAGIATIELDNAGGCTQSFEVPYNACNDCPSSTQPNEPLTICDGETPPLPEAVIQAAVQDPNGQALGAPTPVVSWFEDLSLTIPYLGGPLNHSAADPCGVDNVSLYAAIECVIDGSLINAGSLTVTVYPNPQAPTISIDDAACNYSLVLACPALDNVVSNDFAMTAAPGTDAGTANITLDNAAGCSEDFVVNYDACGGCPGSTEPAESSDICSGDVPILPDATIQAAVSDPGGVAVGAPTPVVSWYTDAALTTAYDGSALTHSGLDICQAESIVLFAAIQCTIDDSFVPAGSLTVNVWPDITATASSAECSASISQDCPTYTATYSFAGATDTGFSYAAQAGEVGTVTFTVTNPNAPLACNTAIFTAEIDCPEQCTEIDASTIAPTSDLCTDEGPFDLSSLLSATANTGGTWTSDAPAGTLAGSAFNPQGLEAGTYVVTYTVDPPAGDPDFCLPESSTQLIEVHAPPILNLSSGITVCNVAVEGSVVDLSQLIINGDLGGVWTDNDNSGASGTLPVLDFDGLAPGAYTFSYTTTSAEAPCEDVSASTLVIVEDCSIKNVLIPNAMSPNNDGVNDQFVVYSNRTPAQFELYIYDRWGKNLFASTDINDSWDGTYKGEDVELDVYVYYCIITFLDGETRQWQGNVTVLR